MDHIIYIAAVTVTFIIVMLSTWDLNQLHVTSGQSVQSTQMRQQNISDYNYNKIFMEYRIRLVHP